MNGENTSAENEYIRFLEKLEDKQSDYTDRIHDITELADGALYKRDTAAFLAVTDRFGEKKYREVLTLSADLLRMKQMAEAVRSEQKSGFTTFIANTDSFDRFRNKYTQLTLLLRRVEFDLPEAEQEECYRYIIRQQISPYSVAAVLYNIISLLGHREKIMLKIASWYLDDGNSMMAYLYLCMIQNPSVSTRELQSQLYVMIKNSEG